MLEVWCEIQGHAIQQTSLALGGWHADVELVEMCGTSIHVSTV